MFRYKIAFDGKFREGLWNMIGYRPANNMLARDKAL